MKRMQMYIKLWSINKDEFELTTSNVISTCFFTLLKRFGFVFEIVAKNEKKK